MHECTVYLIDIDDMDIDNRYRIDIDEIDMTIYLSMAVPKLMIHEEVFPF